MGIVIVFCMGLIKLWSSNRYMRKIEQLDAEKQAHTTQMRQSGLPATDRIRLCSDIPFGVKALESGVEVDGIWTAKQASLASQPPNRKWSSRRKTRTPNSLFEMVDLTSPSIRGRLGSRASRKTGRISQKDIVDPSDRIREKLENMSLLQEADRPDEAMDDGQVLSAGQGHKGPLGRIQTSLRRMRSETWQDQRQRRDMGRVKAGEFHERAHAKKPQRFYPKSEATVSTTTPLVAPRARSHVAENRIEHLLTSHGASQVGGPQPVTDRPEAYARGRRSAERHVQVDPAISGHPFAVRQDWPQPSQQRFSNSSRVSSADSFVTPRESTSPVRVTAPHARRRSSEHRERPSIPVRRSSRGSEYRAARNSAEDGRRSTNRPQSEDAHPIQPSAMQAPRYPPNSSRSGPTIQRAQASSQQPNSSET